jgi:phosphoribosylglycinamide formyltransferase-1
MKTAVLISGRGSNLQALIDAQAEPGWPAEIVLVISNEPGAKGLDRAEAAGIAAAVINHRDFDGREPFDQAMTEAIEASGASFVCLAGFMRLLSDGFIDHWHDRLVNIHPSLLPAYKGLDVQQRVVDAGETEAGCTVHFVRPEMDTGPIILQARVPVLPDDDADTLAARILLLEHVIYPQALRLIAEGRVTVEDERVLMNSTDVRRQT